MLNQHFITQADGATTSHGGFMNPNDDIIRCNLRVHMVYSITVCIFPSLFDDISIDVCLTTANSCKTYRINYIRWLPSGAETCRALKALLAEDPEVPGG